MFKKIIGHDEVKKIFTSSIFATDPVHIIIVGPAGNGKTLFLKAILDIFMHQSLFIDSTISSGIGMIERIFEMAQGLRYLLIDEIEKFSKKDRMVLLNLLETGILSRNLKNTRKVLYGMKVWMFATSNDISKIKRDQPELINRCLVVDLPALDYPTFEHVASIRLQWEQGINEEMARYIAYKVYTEFGRKTDMRKCIIISRLANSHINMSDKYDQVTKEAINETLGWIKSHSYIFDTIKA